MIRVQQTLLRLECVTIVRGNIHLTGGVFIRFDVSGQCYDDIATLPCPVDYHLVVAVIQQELNKTKHKVCW